MLISVEEEQIRAVEGARDAAIKFGEEATDRMIKYGTMAMRHRRVMKAAIAKLERGQPDAAKNMLQDCLDHEERYAAEQLKKIKKISENAFNQAQQGD